VSAGKAPLAKATEGRSSRRQRKDTQDFTTFYALAGHLCPSSLGFLQQVI
jgi:hypothetical protein